MIHISKLTLSQISEPNSAKMDMIKFKTIRAAVPQQSNDSDCGLYLLHFLEMIFLSCDVFSNPDAFNNLDKEWFPEEEV